MVGIFLSYHHADRAYANELVKLLESRYPDVNIWFDKRFKRGESREYEGLTQIFNSNVILCLLSDNYISTKSCTQEFDHADGLKRPIQTILVGAITKALPIKLKNIDAIDLSGVVDKDTQLGVLYDRLDRLLPNELDNGENNHPDQLNEPEAIIKAAHFSTKWSVIAIILASLITGFFGIIPKLNDNPVTVTPIVTQNANAVVYPDTPTRTFTPTNTATNDLTWTASASATQIVYPTTDVPTITATSTHTPSVTPTWTLAPSPTIDLTLTADFHATQTFDANSIMITAQMAALVTFDIGLTQVAQSTFDSYTPTSTLKPTVDIPATVNKLNELLQTPTLTPIRKIIDNANFRSDHDSSDPSNIRQVLPSGTFVKILRAENIGADLWYYVELDNGLTGWVWGENTQYVGKPTQLPNPILQATLAFLPVGHNDQWAPIIETFSVSGVLAVKMVLVPVGCFDMGSNLAVNESPIHQQCVQKPFWIDQTEVTNEQFNLLYNLPIGQNPTNPRAGSTWVEARDFCNLRGARLPTEMEWEYAARGPSSWTYPWGTTAPHPDYLVYGNGSNDVSFPVGSKPLGASWVGALDMSGNVWEWMNTIYDQTQYMYPYIGDNRENLQNLNADRVHRGGSYHNLEIYYMRASYRGYGTSQANPPDQYIGFRCAHDYP